MMLDAVVSDTGPLISLEKLTNGYAWMKQLYEQVLVPSAVAQELCQGMFLSWEAYQSNYSFGEFIRVVEVVNTESFPGCELLDIGERQAIHLARKQGLSLLIEEEKGRQVAKALGLKFSGLAGQILRAHREQVISSTMARSSLAELLKAGRIGKGLYEGLLEALD